MKRVQIKVVRGNAHGPFLRTKGTKGDTREWHLDNAIWDQIR